MAVKTTFKAKLLRQKSFAASSKVFVVALDGSKLSRRGLRIAALLRKPHDQIKILIIKEPDQKACPPVPHVSSAYCRQ